MMSALCTRSAPFQDFRVDYTYDLRGSLLKVEPTSGAKVEYVVDALGRRVERKVNGNVVARWSYRDALRPAAEYDGNGKLVSRFVYASGRNVPDWMVRQESGAPVVYRLLTDERGSVRLVVRMSNGEVVQQFDYDAWGRMTVVFFTSPNMMGLTAQEIALIQANPYLMSKTIFICGGF